MNFTTLEQLSIAFHTSLSLVLLLVPLVFGLLIVRAFFQKSTGLRAFYQRVLVFPFHKTLFFFLGFLTFTVLAYLLTPTYKDHTEASFVMQSLMQLQGAELYTALDSVNRSSIAYGPWAYVLQSAFFAVLLPLCDKPILVSKLFSIGLLLAGLLLLYRSFLSEFSLKRSRLMVSAVLLGYFSFSSFSYLARADAVLLFGVSLTVFALSRVSRVARLCLASFGFALVVGSKIHGGLYCLPLLVTVLPVLQLAAVLGIAVLLAFVPFTVASVSVTHYLSLIQLFSGHAKLWGLFIRNLALYALWTLPITVLMYPFSMSKKQYQLGALLLCSALVVVLGSKEGAGPHHLLPFVPVWVLLFSRYSDTVSTQTKQGLILALCVSFTGVQLFFLSLSSQERVLEWVVYKQFFSEEKQAYQELTVIKEQYAGSAMLLSGIQGPLNKLYLLRPLLYKHRSSNLLDPPAMMDFKLSGLDIPKATIEALQGIDYYIFPNGAKPFSMIDLYSKEPLFSDTFRQAFHEQFKLKEQWRYYSIYEKR